MKNSKGETLKQPYLALAEMRRAQQIDSEWVKNFNFHFEETQRLCSAFCYRETPEMWDFWNFIDTYGQSPAIPAASLAELEAWQKERENPKSVHVKTECIDPMSVNYEPDYKAMYEAMVEQSAYYQKMYDELKNDYSILNSQYQIATMSQKSEPTTSPNWVAECAMRVYASNMFSNAKDAWDWAEKWASEGKKRGHL